MFEHYKITEEERQLFLTARAVEHPADQKVMKKVAWRAVKRRLGLEHVEARLTVNIETPGEPLYLVLRDATTGAPLGTTPNIMHRAALSRVKTLVQGDSTAEEQGYLPPTGHTGIGHGMYVHGDFLYVPMSD